MEKVEVGYWIYDRDDYDWRIVSVSVEKGSTTEQIFEKALSILPSRVSKKGMEIINGQKG